MKWGYLSYINYFVYKMGEDYKEARYILSNKPFAWGNSQGWKLYLTFYPKLSHNTDSVTSLPIIIIVLPPAVPVSIAKGSIRQKIPLNKGNIGTGNYDVSLLGMIFFRIWQGVFFNCTPPPHFIIWIFQRAELKKTPCCMNYLNDIWPSLSL